MKQALKFEDFGDPGEGTLLCPHCGSNNLHHDRIEAFNRNHEDDEIGHHIVLDTDNSTIALETGMDGNPSSRRNGISIFFWCEGCCLTDVEDDPISPDRVVLTIAQHKGATLVSIEWVPA